MPMKNVIAALSLGVGLIAGGGVVSAQDSGVPTINADGNSGSSNAGINPAVDADGPTVVYGDLNTGPGNTVIDLPTGELLPVSTAPVTTAPGTTENVTATDGDAAVRGTGNATAAPGTVTRDGSSGMDLLGPDGTYSVSENTPSNVTTGDSGVPAPVYEAAPEVAPAPVESVEPVIADTVVAVEGDLDGDNYADALEIEVGLDPNNPDGDGDGVADGDEVNIYGTNAFTWDSDGDGLSDGDELFNTRTDPLVWDAEGSQGAVAAETFVAEEVAPAAVGGDSDSDRLADVDEAAVGTDPFTPDSDGDGYYDGDEANLGFDPLDPASMPVA